MRLRMNRQRTPATGSGCSIVGIWRRSRKLSPFQTNFSQISRPTMRAAKPVLFPSVILPSGDPTNPWIEAMVWNNTVEFQDSFSEGIGIYNTKGPTIWMRPSRELTENGIGVG